MPCGVFGAADWDVMTGIQLNMNDSMTVSACAVSVVGSIKYCEMLTADIVKCAVTGCRVGVVFPAS